MVHGDVDDEAPALVELDRTTGDYATQPVAIPGRTKDVALSAAPAADSTSPVRPTPLTILTGFLGAGKTTLVSSLLLHFASLGQRIAIVNNEASAASVEPSLVESSSVMSFGTLLTLANGCVCCSLTSDLISALNYLLKPQPSATDGETAAPFVYVLVECSGLASPGPLLEQLWVDPALEQRVYLDGVVCVVDCKHFIANVSGSEGAQMEQQLVFSDRVLVNKVDTVSDDERRLVESEVRRINSQCDIFATQRSQVAVERILSIRAFDNSVPRHTHSHTASGDCCPGSPSLASLSPMPHRHSSAPHIHDTSLVNLVFSSPRPVSLAALKSWLSELLWTDVYEENGGEGSSTAAPHVQSVLSPGAQCVYRMKAAMRSSDGSVWFLQSVQRLFDLFEAQSDEDRHAVHGVRLVIIGRNLQHEELEAGFQSILLESPEAMR